MGIDLFDFILSPADAAAFDYQPGYGPVNAVSLYSLSQFTDVPTSLGTLDFNTAADIEFFSVGAPGPAPGAGLLGLTFLVLAGLSTKAREIGSILGGRRARA